MLINLFGILIILLILIVRNNSHISFVPFIFDNSTIMAERPSGTRSNGTSRIFSKKRNKFHTIEHRNRGFHPLRVLSPLEGIIPHYRVSQADSIGSFATWKNRFDWLRMGVWCLSREDDWKDFPRQYKTSREILEIFSNISSPLSYNYVGS